MKSHTLAVTVEYVSPSLVALRLIAFDIVLTERTLTVDSCVGSEQSTSWVALFCTINADTVL